MKSSHRTRVLLAGVGCFLALTGTRPWAQAGTLERILEDPRLFDAGEVHAQLAAGVRAFDVVVTLEQSPRTREFSAWDDAEAARQHRGRVTEVQRAVLDTLDPAEFGGRHFLENVPVFAGRASAEGLARLLADPRVASVELDHEVSVHTAQGIGLLNAGGARSVFDGGRLSIAIVDTGIDYNHAALGGGGFPNAKVIGGHDFGDLDSDPLDLNGHGTGAAGVAAGDVVPSGDYVGGVAPGARLYALKISPGSSGFADSSDIQAAWDWCVTHKNDDPSHPILVINTSFGGFTPEPAPCSGGAWGAVASSVKAAGIMNFASAGNEALCAALVTPACFTDVISVGAVYDADLGGLGWCNVGATSCVATAGCGSSGFQCSDGSTAAGQVTCFSNSATFLDLLAPSYAAHVPQAGGGHYDFGGTSAASPYAAGAAALLLDAALASNTPLTPDGALAKLVATGVGTLDPKSGITKPRVDVGAAFATLADVWVDFAWAGAETGSVHQPFNTLAEAVAAAPSGGQVLIKAGTTTLTPQTIGAHVSLRSWGGVARIGP